jgi:uncharacterized protein YacL
VKKLFVPISGLFTYLSLPLLAFAQTPVSIDPCVTGTTGVAKVLCGLGEDQAGTTIRNVVVFLVIVAVLFALIYLLYGGIKWITSKGEKTEVEAARNHIVAAILGLIVVMLAVFILSIILSAFGIKFENLQIPVIGPGAN